ncbi:hypothetical protein LCGC14_1237890 [marine sediment metagenome]|uniref:Tyr recombinase domain-containing protein n=1 Tax=marine sediment metagenome TaxID=412755 RepID=A0A0F9L6R7_9ZZZZ
MVTTVQEPITTTAGAAAPALSLGDLITRFCARRDLARKTRDYYQNILGNLAWFAGARDWPAPELLTREHVREFLSYVATEDVRWPEGRTTYKAAAQATVHHYGKVVKSLFNWAEDEEYLEENPAARVKLGRPHYREVEPYSDDEVRAFLAVCEEDIRVGFRSLGLRNKAIISLFVATGLRLEELSSISLARLDPRLQQLAVTGKGQKGRVVPINGEARKALRAYLAVRPPGGDELWRADDGAPLSRYSVKTMVVRLKRRAGIEGGGGAHRFRHYFATRYLEAGGDINSLRLLLGHATLNMVIKYAKFANVQRALAEHQYFNPLDLLMRGPKPGGPWRR